MKHSKICPGGEEWPTCEQMKFICNFNIEALPLKYTWHLGLEQPQDDEI